ncbi:MAG: glycosyltransferase family 39 protein [Candidatus Stahlbacteria bacterium]|nr:glycosyltransferase family 39 protein [Candidatus Stahlbacteria bacterium]
MRHKKWLIYVLAFGLLIRFLLFVLAPSYDCIPLGNISLPSESSYFKGASTYDSQEYKLLALNLLHHHRFSWNLEPNTFRTPGYPLFIAAIYSIFGPREWIIILLQVLIGTANIYLIYLIGRVIWSELCGIIAGALLSIDFAAIFYGSMFMSDTLFLFFILLGILLFLKTKSPFCGFIFGASAMIRPIAFYLFIPLLFFSMPIKRCVLFLFLFFLPIAPWIIRNYSIYHSPQITSVQGLNLLFCNVAGFEAYRTGKDIGDIRKQFTEELSDSTSNPLHLSSSAQWLAIKKIANAPFKYMFFHLYGATKMLLSTKSDDMILKFSGFNKGHSELMKTVYQEKRVFGKIPFVLLALLEVSLIVGSIILAFIAFIRYPHYPNSFLLALAFFFFILSGGALLDAHLRIPLTVLFYILAARFISEFKISSNNLSNDIS